MPICIRCNMHREPEEMHRQRRHCQQCQRIASRVTYYRARFKRLEQRSAHRAASYGCHVEPVDYAAIYAAAIGQPCPLCDQPLTADNLEFDHARPLAEGGPHSAENVRLVHRSCNREASMRMFVLARVLHRRV